MLLAPKKNRNKKGLLLSSPDIITETDDTTTKLVKSYGPVEVTGSSRSSRASTSSTASSSNSTTSPVPSDSTSHTTSSSRASYHNTLSEQLATLELGVEFKLDLRSEDLQVLNEIGSGNGGTVSKCLHLPTKAIMAKKVVHIATSPTIRKQILRELQIMHECSSPFIVSFYGAYLADPHICMCMEFMDKGSLDAIYKKVGPIPEPILAKIALAVVSGLTYLYEVHKIMHRDVKPSNILLNSAGQIKICDFGVSGELINSVADTFVGTGTYMSPERILGDPYTVKSDVWSLGISLVELAIGRFPFSSSSESDSDEYEDAAPDNKTLSSLPEDSTFEGGRFDNGEDTLKGEGTTKGDEVEMGERIRLAERQAARLSTSIPQSSMIPIPQPRKKKVPAQQHQMSIFDLVQYIVNEPAPQLPLEVKGAGGRGKWSFSQEMREFIDSTLRKEPVGGEKRKKGEVGRPTPRQLLDSSWLLEAISAQTDVQFFAQSIP